jgi:type I restriction enzyme S subunit
MLENLSSGSTFKELSKERLQNFNMPSPSFTEQKKIAELLFTIDKKLDIERSEKVRLEHIKRGLMDLLLTGKIRVKVD